MYCLTCHMPLSVSAVCPFCGKQWAVTEHTAQSLQMIVDGQVLELPAYDYISVAPVEGLNESN